jgi:rRNA-processing arch domain
MLDAKMEPMIAKEMVKGAADTLYSEFSLGYSMLLNMLRRYVPDGSSVLSQFPCLLSKTCWARHRVCHNVSWPSSDGAEPESIMRASYRQFQMEKALPSLELRAAELKQQHSAIEIAQEDQVGVGYDASERFATSGLVMHLMWTCLGLSLAESWERGTDGLRWGFRLAFCTRQDLHVGRVIGAGGGVPDVAATAGSDKR